MHIQRNLYLERLKNRINNGFIKVITGIRRVGKSYLLFNIFKTYLLENITDEEHIIEMQFDKYENIKYQKADEFMKYINEKIKKDDMYYILLDEVQLLENFENILNSLLYLKNLDIYVTGSNSKFLSSDIVTEFRGRGDILHVYPLNFEEIMSISKLDKYETFEEYVTYGGLPLVVLMKTQEQKMLYLKSLFSQTYIKDILERNKIEKQEQIDDLVNILASNIGTLSNPTKIKDTFKSVLNVDISLNTVNKYINYLEDAFLISKVNRYDVKGRKYIGTPLKYYFEDIGLRNARLNFSQVEQTHIMENIIYNELRLRGYSVDVGVVKVNDAGQKKQLEVDFIATLGSDKIYIQSALSLPTISKINQEKASFMNIKDFFKKIIIVKDMIKTTRDEDGIIYINIFDFLLNYESLKM